MTFHSWLCHLRVKYPLQLQHFQLRLLFTCFNQSQQTIIELLDKKVLMIKDKKTNFFANFEQPLKKRPLAETS